MFVEKTNDHHPFVWQVRKSHDEIVDRTLFVRKGKFHIFLNIISSKLWLSFA